MKKKTNINRPNISSGEINQGKNFDQLYKQYAKVSKPFYKKNWFIANTLVVIGAVSLIFLYDWGENNTKTQKESLEPVAVASQTQYAENALIQPPIKGLDVPFSSYEVNAKQGGTIENNTGSFLKIPKNAFVDANGKKVKGKVEIKYREFKDVAEIIASGIPMTYKMGDEEMHFESAGMIEVQGYQDGKPVYLAPGKKIDVEMTSSYDGDHYNLYNLDTAGKEWVDIGKDKIVKKEPAVEDRNQNELEIVAIDSLPNTQESKEIQASKAKVKRVKAELVDIQKNIKQIEKSAPREPQEATNSRFRFNVDYKKEEFPELDVYKGMEFEVGKENKTFTPKWFENEWQDMKLSKGTKDNYNLELTRFAKAEKGSEKDFQTITRKLIVYPVFVGENYEEAMAKFHKKFKTYSSKLETRKADEKKKKEEYEKELARVKKLQEEYAARAEKARKKSQMELDEWIENAEADDNAHVTNNQLYRMFSIEQFGIYNCDTPVRIPNGQTLVAKIYKGDKKAQFVNLYLIEKGRNAVFSLRPGTMRNFKFNPKAENMIVAVSQDNELMIYSVEQFKSIPSDAKTHKFDMDVKETNPKNLKELRKCISFI